MSTGTKVCDAAGVVIHVDAYGKHQVSRVFIRDGKAELVPVTTGRSLGAASRVSSNEMELVAHAIPRGKIVLKIPLREKIKVDGV